MYTSTHSNRDKVPLLILSVFFISRSHFIIMGESFHKPHTTIYSVYP
jgi:hypothetical protein